MHGPEAQHQEHVRDCPRGPRQVHADRFSGLQGRNYRGLKGR